LSLAKILPFLDSALVPGTLVAIEPIFGAPNGTAAHPIVRTGQRLGSFQLKATLYCSKSRVFNCFV